MRSARRSPASPALDSMVRASQGDHHRPHDAVTPHVRTGLLVRRFRVRVPGPITYPQLDAPRNFNNSLAGIA
jgi:hypothetical protein